MMSAKSKQTPSGNSAVAAGYEQEVLCPWCESANTRLVSLYGPSVAEMLFRCEDCRDSFGWLKWQHRLPD